MAEPSYVDNEDLFIEDVFDYARPQRKASVNSKKKGNRVELELCKMLTDHFGVEFSRSVGSGNRWGQINYLPEHARKTLVGDICVPENFKWVIECKGGYDTDVDFSSVLDGGCARIDEFIEQSTHDEQQCGRLPIIFWKRSRKPWIILLRKTDLKEVPMFDFSVHYKDWRIISANTLLQNTHKTFWFETGKNGS